ncbi:TetR/AcrR family transcriptional regulator [Geodermatophilus sp. Leaf369]|uniref:TetR/AcrR family transcriptional regulator n=1 Tax=Geodermatophilus sp. Leaf369 TaxID=1736354 RepID=UPI0009E81AB0|nr:TetR/AcrR family transcriptional regulator [Geodermatophilus sp. Leaf369]
MGLEQSRRERKRARTREQVVTAAQRLFHEQGFDRTTIEDVARAADVAVQTVFNHVASKEELFFADRVPFAQALSLPPQPRPGETCAAAVVRMLTAATMGYLASLEDPQLRDMAAQVEAVPALTRYERTVHTRAEHDLAANLAAAGVVSHPRWTAALLLSTTRVFAHEHRQRVIAGTETVESLARLEAELPHHLQLVLELTAREARAQLV